MSTTGRVSGSVPESCIESAEFIIQCIAKSTKLTYSSSATRQPHVQAVFGNRTINITTEPNLQDLGAGLTDYAFQGGLPEVGQGIICLNKTKSDKGLGYNMHLGAVIARTKTQALISNMSASPGTTPQLKTVETIVITSAAQFCEQAFHGDSNKFALGLLKPS